MKIIFVAFAIIQISYSSKSNWNQFWTLVFQSEENYIDGISLEKDPEGLQISIKIESPIKLPADDEMNESDETLFEDFITKYDKQYENGEEKQNRFEIFQENLRKIEMNNADPHNYATYGIDEFADRKIEEISGCVTPVDDEVLRSNDSIVDSFLDDVESIPKSLDWRDYGYVSKVKSQGKCGSCWAFSTTGMLESSYARKYRKMITFSEQQLLDCFGSCNGNNVYNTLKYIKQAGGIVREYNYPYKGAQYRCKFSRQNVVARVNQIEMLKSDERTMLQAVAFKGPLAVSLNSKLLYQYKGGIIYSKTCPKKNTHAVLLVGYGSNSDGVPYWIIKNSWGAKWGENGFFKLYRGANMCGVASYPTYGNVL